MKSQTVSIDCRPTHGNNSGFSCYIQSLFLLPRSISSICYFAQDCDAKTSLFQMTSHILLPWAKCWQNIARIPELDERLHSKEIPVYSHTNAYLMFDMDEDFNST